MQKEGDHAEFVTVSFWDSRESIEAFAGHDIEKAVFYPTMSGSWSNAT